MNQFLPTYYLRNLYAKNLSAGRGAITFSQKFCVQPDVDPKQLEWIDQFSHLTLPATINKAFETS